MSQLQHAVKNLTEEHLIRRAIVAGECTFSKRGAIVVQTGKCTGRSPNAKHIVFDDITKDWVNWDENQPMSREDFSTHHNGMLEYLDGNICFTQDVYANNDPEKRLAIKVHTTLAWHSLFARNMFIVPDDNEYSYGKGFTPEWRLYYAPEFTKVPKVVISMEEKVVLISGTRYAGEMKKSIFTVLNFQMPLAGILPMHCSVNTALDGGNPAIFFGLSGTGKTTLSSDTNRILIGDDEHSWSERGLYNFEGGCYAKVINLSKDDEPQIWDACQRRGAILENVICDAAGTPDFTNNSLTENTRASYPISFIPNSSLSGGAAQPKNIIMLTCDAFGVLPPVAKLSPSEAVYHFMVGYTAKVAGTEAGVTEPTMTFSHCYGSPFMPLRPKVYAELLKQYIEKNNVTCWLVNTGWTGGKYEKGSRMPISVTRKIIDSIHDGTLENCKAVFHGPTKLNVPSHPDIDINILMPELGWDDKAEYEKTVSMLMKKIEKQYSKIIT